MRPFLLFALVVGLACACRAESVADILETHLAAIGGKARVSAITTLKVKGKTRTPDGEVEFTMYAARPNRVRVETVGKGRTLIQVYDGASAPSMWDSQRPVWRPMDPLNAHRFVADCDFDDPLVGAVDGVFTADYAGTEVKDGVKQIKLLLTRDQEAPFWIYLDPETYLVTGRVDLRPSPVGGTVRIETHYDDFRLAGGILVPRLVSVTEGNQKIQETTILSIESNAEVPADAFVPDPIRVPKTVSQGPGSQAPASR